MKFSSNSFKSFPPIWFAVILFLSCSFVSVNSTDTFWLWTFLGRLHPIIVHFPISIILLVAILELLSFKNFESKFRPTISIALYISSISAVLAMIFGLLLANNEEIVGETLDNHKYIGIATAAFCLSSTFLHWFIQNKNKKSLIKIYRTLVFIAATGVGVSGHLGGSLTHGENYLSEVFLGNEQTKDPNTNQLLAFASDSDSLSIENQLKVLGQVRAIFAHNCYKCHSSNKMEGKLRLDEKEFVFVGGKHGKIIDLENSEKSEIVRRITLPKGHKEAMPGKGKPLTKDEVEIIKFWIKKGAFWPANAQMPNLFRVAKMEPRKPKMPNDSASFENPIDVWVNDYFKKNKIAWSPVVDDKTYLRRVYLDIIGILPSFEETQLFVTDKNPRKKAIIVSQLLSRNNDYTQNWLTFWNDLLRNDYSGTGFITKGRFQITDWLYYSLQNNKPYNVFVKELLSPTEESKGFVSGIQWRGRINASQMVEMQAAQNVSQVLLGLNLKCASCHDSFISDWKLKDAYAFANIFAEETLEINRCDKPTGKYADTKLLWQNFGKIDSMGSKTKKMKQMSDALVTPQNGRLYRTLVNRIWKQMMGRGIVEPVDEMDNEPWSQDLLDWLAVDFVEKNYNIKDLIFLIATSKIYQSNSSAYPAQSALYASTYKFSGMARRRLSAEQFSDAISKVIFPVFKSEDIKIKLVSSELGENKEFTFTRASLVANNRFLTALGRPNREIVITSRDSQANLLEALELTNGVKLTEVLKSGALVWQKKYPIGKDLVTDLYKKAFRREPKPNELKAALAILGNTPKTEQIQDLFWAVILLPEFQLIY